MIVALVPDDVNYWSHGQCRSRITIEHITIPHFQINRSFLFLIILIWSTFLIQRFPVSSFSTCLWIFLSLDFKKVSQTSHFILQGLRFQTLGFCLRFTSLFQTVNFKCKRGLSRRITSKLTDRAGAIPFVETCTTRARKLRESTRTQLSHEKSIKFSDQLQSPITRFLTNKHRKSFSPHDAR